MSESDRTRWDVRWTEQGPAPVGDDPPPGLADLVDLLPASGSALDVACGRGRGTVWLARRGFDVWAFDVSPVAVDLARDLAAEAGVVDRCRFDVVDLDAGLPEGPPVDLILCHLFRDVRLDQAMAARLRPGGVLALVALSEVGAGPGPFRMPEGALRSAFPGLEVLAHDESEGMARLVARRHTTASPIVG